ncbi:acyltransferase family protein [Rhodococcus sp. IEGM 1379]|uniref:acyltransferase family protein n=1 Tax=Rhodococcus sp. IEGM 1379 TaxID=3047086 RepID=UPI0024B79CBB|nr:acyltransferase family protein [Rhodococcus sp. IEGM 1379]MDI9918605.1 acyltransferase family protein [Rhodococcus sp. IEGM 1379]
MLSSNLTSSTVEPPQNKRTTQYRQDLNGLRGLAIALVVVFHVWFGKVSGGVDVFLVLSGYFFVGSLVRRAEHSSPSPNPLPALRRVFVRLFPPIAAVAFLTAIASLLLLPRTRWADLADQLTAVLGFFQNWQLALTANDYLAADGSVSPLQHLWSMAVQGQFYLLAIVVVLTTASVVSRTRPELLRATLAAVFIVLAAGSFVYATVMSSHDQAWNYYDSAARLWEPSVGALAALMLTRWNITRVGAWPPALRTILGSAGLFSILLCGFFLDGSQQFPGPWALVPTLATIALIVSGTGGGDKPWTAAVLAHPALAWLGSFAFALYLVHWPILIFTLVVTGRPEADFFSGALIITASIAAAHALRQAVEAPIERGNRARRPILLTSVISGLVIVASMFAWQGYVGSHSTGQRAADTLDIHTHPGALALTNGAKTPRASMVPSIFDASLDLPATTLDGCIADFQQNNIVHCTYGDENANRTIALAGGSHSEHWITALDELGQSHGFRVDTYLKMGCPLTAGDGPSDYPDCVDWSNSVIDELATTATDFVFTTATRPSPDGPGDVTPEDYVNVWRELGQHGTQVLAIRDTPWLHYDGVPYRAVDCLATATSPDHCALPRPDMLSDVNPASAAIADLSNVRLLDVSDGVCGPELCRVVEGNVLVYHDSHHLTASYVRTLVPELERQLGSATDWW